MVFLGVELLCCSLVGELFWGVVSGEFLCGGVGSVEFE